MIFMFVARSGQPGALMIQQPMENLFNQDTALLEDRIQFSEEVDAVFFDANNDCFPDLFVVSGGNEI